MDKVVDEYFLKAICWKQIGNTWYPPAFSHKRQFESPLMFWCRVDGTLRICGSEWMSEPDISVSKFRQVCEALDVEIMK